MAKFSQQEDDKGWGKLITTTLQATLISDGLELGK